MSDPPPPDGPGLELARTLERSRVRAGLFKREIPAVTVGRFQILGVAGAGGMGVVFSAYDPQLDRRVAIKLLKHTQGEATALARLSHPNIVGVHEAGTHEDSVYVAMEWVEGQTLRSLVEDDQAQ